MSSETQTHLKDQPSGLDNILKLIGGVLIMAGLVFFVTFALMAHDLITNPSVSPVYQFVNSTLVSSDQVISGEFDGKKFELRMNEDLRNFCFIFMSIIAGSILFGIANSLLLTGASLLRPQQDKRRIT